MGPASARATIWITKSPQKTTHKGAVGISKMPSNLAQMTSQRMDSASSK